MGNLITDAKQSFHFCCSTVLLISNFLHNFMVLCKVVGQYSWPEPLETDFVYGRCISIKPKLPA